MKDPLALRHWITPVLPIFLITYYKLILCKYKVGAVALYAYNIFMSNISWVLIVVGILLVVLLILAIIAFVFFAILIAAIIVIVVVTSKKKNKNKDKDESTQE